MRTKRILSVTLFLFVLVTFGIIVDRAHAKPPAAPSAPSAPAGKVGATAGCPVGVLHCTNLTWNASVADASHGAAAGYNVYRSMASGGCSNLTATTCQKLNGSTLVTGTSYTDSPLAASTTYFYVVTGVNTAGESTPSNQYSGTTQPDPAPNAPTNLSGVTQ